MPYYDCVREKYLSSIEVADKTEDTYECDKLLSEEFTDYSHAILYQNKTSKVVAFTPYYDSVKMPRQALLSVRASTPKSPQWKNQDKQM